MELGWAVKKVLDLVPGEYGSYRIERYDNGSYFDVVVEDTEDVSLVMQFSVVKEDGYVWDINISDLDKYQDFLEFLDKFVNENERK